MNFNKGLKLISIFFSLSLSFIAYPLGALDSIFPDGSTNWGSAMMIILAGKKEEHLNMLEGGIIAKLLEEKWSTFAQMFFIKVGYGFTE